MSTSLVITEEAKNMALAKPMTDLITYNDFVAISEQLIGSAFMPSHIADIPTLASILLMGKELHLTPMSSIQNIVNINGKLTLTASAMGALLRKHNVRYILSEDKVPVFGDVWVDPNDETKGTYNTIVDYRSTMKFLELWNGQIIENVIQLLWSEAVIIATDNYKRDLPGTYIKYARNMMTARLLTRGVRLACPEAIMGGLYTPDELILDAGQKLSEEQLKSLLQEDVPFEIVEDDSATPPMEEELH